MIKETITYKDFLGNERTEDFRFHLTEAELLKMEMGISGGFIEYTNRIVAAQNAPEIIRVFEELLQKSYGVMSPDGKRFMKTPELLQEFIETEAYSQLFTKLATDDEAAAKFINGVVPAEMAAKAKAAKNIQAIPSLDK